MTCNIALLGATGRLGKEIILNGVGDPRFSFVGAVGLHTIGDDIGILAGTRALNIIVTDNIGDAIANADVVIDVALAEGFERRLETVARQKKPYVIGTTGLSASARDALAIVAQSIPVLHAANFSIGITLILAAARELAKKFPASFDVAIVEAHHTKKKDAPSGTALILANAIEMERSRAVDISSIRAGDIVGDHTILFAGPGERVEIKHQAHSRATFALGALTAAEFLATKTPGLYTMDDVLSTKQNQPFKQ